jgi:hypothetical protein
MSIETHTLRNNPSELALPMRKWDVPPVGDGLGGAGAHWNGVTWRFAPSEFALRSHLTERYGRNAIPEEMTIRTGASLMTISSPITSISSGCAGHPARPETCAARRSRVATRSRGRARTNIRTSL